MIKHPFPPCDPARVDAAAARLGLTVTMRGTLAKYPGCTHWHLAKPGQRGVVEVTVWLSEAWVEVRSGRDAPWTLPAAAALADALR